MRRIFSVDMFVADNIRSALGLTEGIVMTQERYSTSAVEVNKT